MGRSNSSIEETDRESAAVAKVPGGRVSLAQIEAAISGVYHTTADKAVGDAPVLEELKLLSVCFIVMRNGFVIVGKSAPAHPSNFNADLGRKFAYEDAIRQLWPLMAFSLKDRQLTGDENDPTKQ